jgi:hypothetical protein
MTIELSNHNQLPSILALAHRNTEEISDIPRVLD